MAWLAIPAEQCKATIATQKAQRSIDRSQENAALESQACGFILLHPILAKTHATNASELWEASTTETGYRRAVKLVMTAK